MSTAIGRLVVYGHTNYVRLSLIASFRVLSLNLKLHCCNLDKLFTNSLTSNFKLKERQDCVEV